MVLAQTDAAAIEVMERIATSQYIMTIVMVIMLIMAAGGALIFMMEFGKLRKLMRDTSILMDELKRVAVPLIEGAAVTVSEAAKITTEMHTRVGGLMSTLESIDMSIQRGAIATEERVRRFGQVLDVVQTETEELLLDAAATAHGVHETARMLREPRPRRVVRRPTEIELDPDEDLGGWDDRTR
jgi:hypothetical protein